MKNSIILLKESPFIPGIMTEEVLFTRLFLTRVNRFSYVSFDGRKAIKYELNDRLQAHVEAFNLVCQGSYRHVVDAGGSIFNYRIKIDHS